MLNKYDSQVTILIEDLPPKTESHGLFGASEILYNDHYMEEDQPYNTSYWDLTDYPLYLVPFGCGSDDNCTKFCSNTEEVLASLSSIHNCVTLPVIESLLAGD